MTENNPYKVKTGQIWEGCDPRWPDSRITVVQVREDYGYAQVLVEKNKRLRRVQLKRFRPWTNGYRLVKDV